MSPTKSSLAITDHKLIPTLHGVALVYEGHVFSHARTNLDQTSVWKCNYNHQYFFPHSCPAKLYTIEDDRVICDIVGKHSAHWVDPIKPKVLEYRQYLREQATTTQNKPKEIIKLADLKFDTTIISAAGTRDAKQKIISRARTYANYTKRNVFRSKTSRIASASSRSLIKTKHARPNMFNKKKRALLRNRRMRHQSSSSSSSSSSSVPSEPPSPISEISNETPFDLLHQQSNGSHNTPPTQSSSPSSLAITDHKLISTSRGISLVHKGHVFTFTCTSWDKKSLWRCIYYHKIYFPHSCPARLYTIEEGTVICDIVGQHSAHTVDPNKPKILEYKQYLMEKAATTQNEPKEIIKWADEEFGRIIGSAAGIRETKYSIIKNARKHPRVFVNHTNRSVSRLKTSRIASSRSVSRAKRARPNMLNKKKRVLLRNRRVERNERTNEIQLRLCLLWSRMIGAHDRVQYVKLNIKESGSPLEWKPVPSIRAMQFESVWDEPTDLNPDQKGSYTMPQEVFNQQMAKSFGSLFRNMKTLVIYFDLPYTESHIQNLIDLLSKCTKVESLSLIMSSEISVATTLSRICHTINTDVQALTRLDLFVSDYEKFGRHSRVDLFQTIPLVTHLGLSCSPENLLPLLIKAGSMNEKYRQNRKENHSLQSLSIQCRLSGPNMDKLFTANPEYSLVKRLQLTCVFNFDFVQNYLKLFNNVETLQLYACQPSTTLTLKKELIEHLRQLPKLSELTLVDFGMVMDLPNEPNCQLPTVKKFTIAAHDLFTRYRRVTGDNLLDRFVETIVHLFPALEELVLLAGEIGQPIGWEQISSELPKLFMFRCPTLQRVTINIKHPTLMTVAKSKRKCLNVKRIL